MKHRPSLLVLGIKIAALLALLVLSWRSARNLVFSEWDFSFWSSLWWPLVAGVIAGVLVASDHDGRTGERLPIGPFFQLINRELDFDVRPYLRQTSSDVSGIPPWLDGKLQELHFKLYREVF